MATARVSSRFAGFTTDPPGSPGTDTLFSFDDPGAGFLGYTRFLVRNGSADILRADVILRSSAPWTLATSEPGRYSLYSVTLHEIGHVLGLGHSMIGETMPLERGVRVIAMQASMFPIAFSAGSPPRQLAPDDIVGLSNLNPAPGFGASTGTIHGRVVRSGRGVPGAHVAAFDLETGALVAAFTLDAGGNFTIAGLSPGPKLLRVEPLDDAAVASFSSLPPGVDTAFAPAFHGQLVIVPRGGTTALVSIEVSGR